MKLSLLNTMNQAPQSLGGQESVSVSVSPSPKKNQSDKLKIESNTDLLPQPKSVQSKIDLILPSINKSKTTEIQFMTQPILLKNPKVKYYLLFIIISYL